MFEESIHHALFHAEGRGCARVTLSSDATTDTEKNFSPAGVRAERSDSQWNLHLFYRHHIGCALEWEAWASVVSCAIVFGSS